ncbi:hypothetical protein A2U01_0096262, partial [Trifolium medium]|nr:hypothetical protein [Trifolium medium]
MHSHASAYMHLQSPISLPPSPSSNRNTTGTVSRYSQMSVKHGGIRE